MAVRLGSAYGIVEVTTGNSLSNLRALEAGLLGLGPILTGLLTPVGLLTTAFVGLGIAAVAGISKAIGEARNLEEQVLDTVALVGQQGLGSFEEDLAAVSILLRDITINPNLKANADDAAKSVQMLLKNGVDLLDIMGGEGGRGGLAEASIALANALAEGGGTHADLKQAADIVTDAFNLFAAQGLETEQVINSISGAVLNSKFDLTDYRYALANAGGVAAITGAEFEELNTAIALLSPSFRSGRDAGTSIKTFLQRLVPTSDKAKEAIAELNLQFFDLGTGEFLGFETIFKQLAEVFDTMSEFERADYLKRIFGAEGARAAAVAIERINAEARNGVDIWADMHSRVNEQTDALEIAETRMASWNRQWEVFTDLLQDAWISLGLIFTTGTAAWLKNFNQQLEPLIRMLRDFSDAIIAGQMTLGDFIEQLKEFVNVGDIAGLQNFLKEFFAWDANTANEFLDNILMWLQEKWPVVKAQMEQWSEILWLWITEAVPRVFQALGEWLLELNIWATSGEGRDRLRAIGEQLGVMLVEGMALMSQNRALMAMLAVELIAFFVTIAGMLLVTLINIGGQLIIGLIQGMIDTYGPPLAEMLDMLIQSIREGLNERWAEVTEWFNEGWRETFRRAWELLTGDLIPQLILMMIQQLGIELRNGARELIHQMDQIGRDMMGGLANGLNGQIGRIMSIVNGIADRIRRTFQSAMQSYSPSRVFQGFGEDIQNGLALGLVRNMGRPIAAVSQTTQGMMSQATAGMDRFGPGSGGSGDTRMMKIGPINVYDQSGDPRQTARLVRREIARLFEQTQYAGGYR